MAETIWSDLEDGEVPVNSNGIAHHGYWDVRRGWQCYNQCPACMTKKEETRMTPKPHVINPDDLDYDDGKPFWKNIYKLTVTRQGSEFIVNANNEEEAIDFLIDYCEEHCPGLIVQDEDDIGEERIFGGSHGRYLSTDMVVIEPL